MLFGGKLRLSVFSKLGARADLLIWKGVKTGHGIRRMTSKQPKKETRADKVLSYRDDRVEDPDATLGIGNSRFDSALHKTGRYQDALGDWIGPYQLIEVIGSGGMGIVYRAIQQEPVKREVALKIIKAGMDTEQVIARFEAERQALSMMEHANIARVLDAGATQEGRPYFVMELVRGISFTQFCDDQKMTIESRLKLFCKICDAVQHAHQKGIIHRDLKPSNVLCAIQDGKPMVKIIDFGVAKATGQRLTEKTMATQQGQVVGTLEYMSPEQAQLTESNVDTRTDIYSLGVLLYELLTGNTPLTHSNISKLGFVEILSRIKDEDAVKPSSRISESSLHLREIAEVRGVEPKKLSVAIRGDLDWIVLKALEKDPERRYDSAAALADDIEHYLNAEPIDARPPTSFYLASKFARRHKVAVSMGAVTAAVLIAGIVLTTSQWLIATEAKKTIKKQLEELENTLSLKSEVRSLAEDLSKVNLTAKAELASEIELLAGFGRWEEVLQKIQTYRNTDEFLPVPMDLELVRLEALDGLSKNRELRIAIRQLEAEPEAVEFEAQLQLWRGYAFWGESEGDKNLSPLQCIRQAIQSDKLSPSDECFARGLINPSLPDSLTDYQKSLSLLPYHSRARTQIIVTLIVLGRHDEVMKQLDIAESMFPDDPRYQYAEFAANAFANKRLATELSRGKLRGGTSQARRKDLLALGRLSTAVNNQLRTYDRDGWLDWFSIIRQGIPLAQESSYRSIPVAAFQKQRLFSAYGQFAASFLNPLMQIAKEDKKNQLIIRNCRAAWAIHEDGLFKCFEAWSWFELGDYENSAQAFLLAANSDSLFPANRVQGGYGVFLSRKKQFDVTGDKKWLDQSMQYLQSYVDTRFENHRVSVMFEAATEAGRWDIAEKITREMIQRDGGMTFSWQTNLMNAAQLHGNMGLALSVCDQMLAASPNNKMLQKRRRGIQAEIASELLKERSARGLR